MTLKEKIEDTKRWYEGKYGSLDWHYYDEGIDYAIGDYFSQMGEFTEEDRKYAESENILMDLEWIEEESSVNP